MSGGGGGIEGSIGCPGGGGPGGGGGAGTNPGIIDNPWAPANAVYGSCIITVCGLAGSPPGTRTGTMTEGANPGCTAKTVGVALLSEPSGGGGYPLGKGNSVGRAVLDVARGGGYPWGKGKSDGSPC